MSLTAGLKAPRDMLAKLHTEHSRLKTTVTSGDLMNFAITGYHLMEWIERNPATPVMAQNELEAMYRNTDIGVCRDITNEIKHFKLKKGYKDRVTDKTSAVSGYGDGGYGKGPYGIGEESIVVVLLDGTRFDSLPWAQRVVDAWDAFFSKHGL
jgi:hypothetical protein